MPLQAPIIDDRRFEDIVEEARTLIPRYTPEWTDLNDNEPGMALVQLFAWMTDMMLFRLAQVPEAHYIKFLQLLGIELRPAEPAHAEITFPLSDTQPEQIYRCMEGIVRRAHFPPFRQTTFRITYPFSIRPPTP